MFRGQTQRSSSVVRSRGVISLAAMVALMVPISLAPQVPGVPDRYLAVSELTIGDADGPVALTRVGQITVQGPRVYVSQPAEQRIRVFSADSGELLDEWGSRGDGPGEFQRLFWMGGTGDGLVAVDSQLHRITHFAFDGTVTRTLGFRLPPPDPPFVFAGWIMPTLDGNLVVFGDVSLRAEGSSGEHPWVLASPDGEVLDALPPLQTRDRSIVIRGDGGSSTSLNRPIHRGDRFAMASDGSLFVQAGDAEGRGLSLSIYDVVDRRSHVVDTGIPPVDVDPTLGDSIMRPIRDALTREQRVPPGVSSGELDQAFAAPEWVPAVDEMFVTAEGEVWMRVPNLVDGSTHDVWNVVGPDATYRAVVEVPAGLVLMARDADLVWGFRLDEVFGFVMIERLRLEPVN